MQIEQSGQIIFPGIIVIAIAIGVIIGSLYLLTLLPDFVKAVWTKIKTAIKL